MGRFRKFVDGIVERVSVESQVGSDRKVATMYERPTGSTDGVVFISQWVNGEGVATEQFSGERKAEAATAWQRIVDAYRAAEAARAAQKAARAAQGVAKAPAQPVAKGGKVVVLWSDRGIVARVIQGANARYEIEVDGQVVASTAVTKNWRVQRSEVIADAQRRAAQRPRTAEELRKSLDEINELF